MNAPGPRRAGREPEPKDVRDIVTRALAFFGASVALVIAAQRGDIGGWGQVLGLGGAVVALLWLVVRLAA